MATSYDALILRSADALRMARHSKNFWTGLMNRRHGRTIRPVPIRFQCSSCQQPIEVDDEWASRTVACPYCHKTITAPAESTLGDTGEVPTASPLGTGGAASFPAASGSPNTIAVVAFVLSCAMLGLMAGSCAIGSAHSLEYQKFAEEIQKAQAESRSPWQAISDYAERQGGKLPRWLVVMTGLQMAAMAGCVAAVICGLLGLRSANRRPLAICALIISGGALVLFCAGILVAPGMT